MSKGLQWIIGISIILIVGAMAFATVAPFFLPQTALPQIVNMPCLEQGAQAGGVRMFGHFFGGRGGMGMGGMRGGMFLGPLLLIGLIVVGAIWFTRRKNQTVTASASVANTPCPKCGQPIQPGWKACPHCGEKI